MAIGPKHAIPAVIVTVVGREVIEDLPALLDQRAWRHSKRGPCLAIIGADSEGAIALRVVRIVRAVCCVATPHARSDSHNLPVCDGGGEWRLALPGFPVVVADRIGL